jgi:hypothetical protein
MAKNVIIPAPYNEWYSLAEAAESMGYKHAQYIRQLVIGKKLGEYGKDFVKVDMGNFEKWLINPASCEAYKERVSTGAGGFGAPGLRRYLIRFNTERVTVEQLAAILTDALGPSSDDSDDDDFVYQFAPAWSGKSKKGGKKPVKREDFTARILESLTQPGDEDDTEDEDDAEDDEDLDDVLA